MVGLRRYLEHEEFVHKRLSREIDKLTVIDAGAAWSLKAMYCTAFGKADEAIYASETAMRNNISTPQMGNLVVNVYGNLAAHSKGLEYLKRAADPRNGHFTSFINWLVVFGGIRAAREHCERARTMGIEVPTLPIDLDRAISAIDGFDTSSLDDSMIATILDVFCGVMMKHGFLISENRTRMVQFEDGAIQFQLPVEVAPDVAAEMTLDAIDRLVKLPFNSSAVSVSFTLRKENSTEALQTA